MRSTVNDGTPHRQEGKDKNSRQEIGVQFSHPSDLRPSGPCDSFPELVAPPAQLEVIEKAGREAKITVHINPR